MKQQLTTLCLLALGLFVPTASHAQQNQHLRSLTNDVKEIRKQTSAEKLKKLLNETVLKWSATGQPKLTLMDEIFDPKEYRGNGARPFCMDQLVTFVYARQNQKMVSKGDFFNSTERDVYYSAIEKTVEHGKPVSYEVRGHAGPQEFVFIAYNKDARFTITVNGKPVKDLGDGVKNYCLSRCDRADVITISITVTAGDKESFVILNHNPQK